MEKFRFDMMNNAKLEEKNNFFKNTLNIKLLSEELKLKMETTDFETISRVTDKTAETTFMKTRRS